MLVLSAEAVRLSLPMPETIEAMKKAYAAFTCGQAEVPLRLALPVPPQKATCLFMPAFVRGSSRDALAVKIVSLFPENPPTGLPLIHAAVVALDPLTGQVQALLEGGSLTAIRTGAGAGAATDLLARRDSRVAAVFGAGVQARTQIEAMCAIRPVRLVRVFAPTRAHVDALIAELQPHLPARIQAADSPSSAVQDADIICTATTATTPVFSDQDMKPGVHINGVGSYTPEMVEIPPETVARSEVFVDSLESAMAEAGEILAAINRKLLFPAELTEIGAVALGTAPGRSSDLQTTFFKSVGVAVQDAVAAQLALENARARGLGVEVNW